MTENNHLFWLKVAQFELLALIIYNEVVGKKLKLITMSFKF